MAYIGILKLPEVSRRVQYVESFDAGIVSVHSRNCSHRSLAENDSYSLEPPCQMFPKRS